MGLYTDPDYFEKQAHYQHRKVKKVIKAVSSKPKQPTPDEAASEASAPIEPEAPSHDIPNPTVGPDEAVFDESPDLTQMTQEEYDAYMMGMTVPQYRVYLQMVEDNARDRARAKRKKQRPPETHILLAALKPIFYVAVIGIGAYFLVEFYNAGVENTPKQDQNPPIETVNNSGGTTVSLQPKNIYNGQMVTWPSGDQVAPLTVSTSGDTNYYIVLKPIDGEARSNGGMSFLVTGTSAEVDVPLGTYAIYYACGADWYGKTHKFGEQTEYFKCNETFEFTSDGEMVYGWTLTLYKVSNGNMTTDEVPESSFPDI